MVQLATRVDDAVGETFKSLTKQLGTTPADAMRMFVMAFNANQGFPYEVRVKRSAVEPLSNEREALDFIDSTSSELTSDSW